MKPSILLQLDVDPEPSVFDAVVALDAGADHLLRHGSVRPEMVRDLVHGLLFTRGVSDLGRSAVFVGGSDAGAAEAVFEAVKATFFGPFRVSALLDPNGGNTTAAAAVLAAIEGAGSTRGTIAGATVAVLGGTGPVGLRVVRLLLGLEGAVTVRLGSRSLDRARAAADSLKAKVGLTPEPFATGSPDEVRTLLDGADVAIAAGAAGVSLISEGARAGLDRLKVLIDLNAVPPLGIAGVEATDRKANRAGVLAWGALGVGGAKMKIHKAAIRELFSSNDKVLDAESILALGRGPGSSAERPSP